MARLNNDARKILCDMVAEKASEKRSALVAELDKINANIEAGYKRRLAAARVKIDEAIRYAYNKIDTILTENWLTWGKHRYDSGKYTLDDILCGDELKSAEELTQYIKSVNTATESKMLSALKQDIAELDAKVDKAKQEIILRAALGVKYEDAVKIVNGFEF